MIDLNGLRQVSPRPASSASLLASGDSRSKLRL